MILISSFAKKPKEIPAISIARYQPRKYFLPELKILAPIDRYGEKLSGYNDPGEYRKLYKTLLLTRKEAVRAWLDTLNKRRHRTLCCWCNLEQQKIKGYETIMCHSILVAFIIRKYRPDIHVYLDWDRFRYSVWPHKFKCFDLKKFLRSKMNAKRL